MSDKYSYLNKYLNDAIAKRDMWLRAADLFKPDDLESRERCDALREEYIQAADLLVGLLHQEKQKAHAEAQAIVEPPEEGVTTGKVYHNAGADGV